MSKINTKPKAKTFKMKVRKGDTVKIIAGKDRGQIGIVAAVDPTENKVLVVQQDTDNPDNYMPLNAVTKHKKARFQGQKSARFKMPAPLHASNVMVIDPTTNEPTRVGRKVEGDKIVRYAKKSGVVFEDKPNLDKE